MHNNVFLKLFNAIKISESQKSSVLKYNYSSKSIILLSVFFKEGLIRGYFLDTINNIKIIYILIKYKQGKFNLSKYKSFYFNIKNIYSSLDCLKRNQNFFNFCIVSTRKGFMSEKNAIALGLGGFIVIKIT
jgi:ribosomal protein S8